MSNTNDDDGSTITSSSPKSPQDPYATLNLSPTATQDEIQRSYRDLSLAFHPDKQRARGGTSSGEKAREIFVEFKKCHDLLMDPVLRLGYDLYGYEGVKYLEKSKASRQQRRRRLVDGKSSMEPTVYQKISFLLEEAQAQAELMQGGGGGGESKMNSNIDRNVRKAVDILNEAMQYYQYIKPPPSSHTNTTNTTNNKMKNVAPPEVSSEVVLECSTLQSNFLGEGVEPLGSIDIEKTKVNLSVKTPIPLPSPPKRQSTTDDADNTNNNNTNNNDRKEHEPSDREVMLTLGGGGGVRHDGHSQFNTTIGLSYESSKGSDVHLDIEIMGDDGAIEEEEEEDEELRPQLNDTTTNSNNNNKSSSSSFSIHNHSKLSIGSSRVMSNGTYLSWNMSTIPQSSQCAFSIATHRSLFRNTMVGTWAMGMGSDLRLHYGVLSFTSRNGDGSGDGEEGGGSRRPKVTTKFNLGLGAPVQCIVEKEFSGTHSGKASFGWSSSSRDGSGNGGGGIMDRLDVQILSKRKITKYCSILAGLQHVPFHGGLKVLFQLERGSMSVKVPISVVSGLGPGYTFKALYISSLIALIDEVIGDYTNMDHITATTNSSSGGGGGEDDIDSLSLQETQRMAIRTRREQRLLEHEKIKRDALRQMDLMRKPAMAKRKVEEEDQEKGLVITRAVYTVEGGDTIDVTVALQFWVTRSTLRLPRMTKSSMLGFYDVRGDVGSVVDMSSSSLGLMESVVRRFERFCRSFGLGGDSEEVGRDKSNVMPTLTVRYRYGSDLYEITILDNEELHLPSKDAMKLGNGYVQ